MLETEILVKGNGSRLLQVAPTLAETYKNAFSGSPWYEVSRCNNPACQMIFSALDQGEDCEICKYPLIEAYDTKELTMTWLSLLNNSDATFYISYDTDGQPVRATIARPTDTQELVQRKYQTITQMQPWLEEKLAGELVWIEDTFANRNKQPSGNLRDRGRILGDIAMRYGGLVIATRTLQPAIVRATVRDLGQITDVFLGADGVGAEVTTGARSVGDVPDKRTLIRIGETI